MTKKSLSEDQVQIAIKMYESGYYDQGEIARIFGVHHSTISNWLRKNGVYGINHNKLRHINPSTVNMTYRFDSSSLLTGEKFGVGSGTVIRYLRKNGYDIKPKRRNRLISVNEDFFNDWSEKSAYWIGFITADGCVYPDKNRLSITLSAKDVDHLIKFRDDLSSECEIRYETKNSFGGSHLEVNVGLYSDKIFNSLSKAGIHQGKTYNLKWNQVVPDEYMNHYVRGFFDGDGTIGVYFSPSKGCSIYRFGLFGNKDYLDGMANYISSACGVPEKKSTPSVKGQFCHRVTWNGLYQIQSICEYMYKDATVYLDRKRAIAVKIMGVGK